MTMSMVGPGLTTTSYKKRKQTKRTKNQQAAFELRHRDYNKSMKRMGCHSQMMTLEEYDLYVRGKYKPKEKKGEFKELVPSPAFQRTQKHYPSAGNGIGVATKKESPTYSGERQLLGIATMHKSNMVHNLTDTKEAKIKTASLRR